MDASFFVLRVEKLYYQMQAKAFAERNFRLVGDNLEAAHQFLESRNTNTDLMFPIEVYIG
jgi:hypothetical protein